MCKALKTYIQLKNPHYKNINVNPDYTDSLLMEDPLGFDLLFPENPETPKDEILEEIEKRDSPISNEPMATNYLEEIENECDDSESEDYEYKTTDPIQKWKFNYDEKATYIPDYPEMNVEENKNNDSNVADISIKVAPGEGKTPSNILKTKDWDTSSFPNLHPDGKNGLHEERRTKLTDPNYFKQRILNHDRRFSLNTEYVFAAHSYLELRRFESNINISFMRGKKNDSRHYSLDDAYSVLDNSPGTPKYWQKKRYELIGKLENFGPFPIFFTLSFAE